MDMRTPVEDEYDQQDLDALNAEPWMAELLNYNPDYPHWGPGEDAMYDDLNEGVCESWTDFGPWTLDDFNEIINFYFAVERAQEECAACGGTGYSPDALWVAESFYKHSSPFRHQTADEERARLVMASFGVDPTRPLGKGLVDGPPNSVLAKYSQEFWAFCDLMRHSDGCWHDKITQDEVQALADEGRLHDYTHTWQGADGWVEKDPPCIPTAEEVNRAQHTRGVIHTHDAINRCILVRTRCARYGIPLHCETCDGNGYVYTEPAAHVSLVLWAIHPRKGRSHGVKVKNIQQSELPAIFTWLRGAAERNAARFSKIPLVETPDE